MFEKFGEFGSYEELNMAAAGLVAEGDFGSLKMLCHENGIDEEDMDDYLDDIIPALATKSSAAFGRLQVINNDIATEKDVVKRMALMVIVTMLEGMMADETMQAAVMSKGKDIRDIYKAMEDEARLHKSGNMGMSCGTDRQLCEIIRAYYLGNDYKACISNLYR